MKHIRVFRNKKTKEMRNMKPSSQTNQTQGLLHLEPHGGAYQQGSDYRLLFYQFYFLQFAFVKSLNIFTIAEICPSNHLKAEKIGLVRAVSSLFAIFCFLPPSSFSNLVL